MHAHMRWVSVIGMTVLAALPSCGQDAPAGAGPLPDEFIKVGPDSFSFVGAQSGEGFVPLGTNFVLTDKSKLDIFAPDKYDHDLYARALDGVAGCGMNIVKVFFAISGILPDPQGPSEATIAPGYLDNLQDFLAMAKARDIRVCVCLACWGGNGIKWWHDGGEYFGRKPWKTDDGVDSLAVLRSFWTQLCTRFRDDPTVFSWSPSVEWSFPAGNLTWVPPGKQLRLESEQGVYYWRAFAAAQYDGDLDALNAAWGTDFATVSDITLADYEYNFATNRYGDSDAKVQAYQDFKEWASMRYFRPQIEAMRAADPNHMVTIANHMRRPIGLWPGAAQYFIGFSEPEQNDLVDYLTTHDNHSHSELRPGSTIQDVVNGSILRARFCNARGIKPLIIEELTYGAEDPQIMADTQAKMVLGTVGSVSGWMNWYLQYPAEPNEADTPGAEKSAVLQADFTPTLWGERVKGLKGELDAADLSRQPARTVIECDRMREMVPHEMGTEINVVTHWGDYDQPIDYVWPENRCINMPLLEER